MDLRARLKFLAAAGADLGRHRRSPYKKMYGYLPGMQKLIANLRDDDPAFSCDIDEVDSRCGSVFRLLLGCHNEVAEEWYTETPFDANECYESICVKEVIANNYKTLFSKHSNLAAIKVSKSLEIECVVYAKHFIPIADENPLPDSIEYLDTIYPFKGNNILAMGVDTYNQLPNSHYFKEHLQTKLISGIKPGKKYKISFYYNFSQYYESKIDFLEFYFSKNAINYYATFY